MADPPARTHTNMAASGDVRPTPDPTEMTRRSTEAAKDDLRREVDFVRQLLTQRVDGTMQVLTQRLDDIDAATRLLQDWRETLPRRLEDALKCYRDVVDERFATTEERFRSLNLQFVNVQTQFGERDTRADMMAQSGEKNIASALAAAKELVAAQNSASSTAIDKSARDTDKRIDTTVQLLQTSTGALDGRIAALAEQAKTSMTRQEVEQLFRTVMDKLDGPTGLAMRLESVIARGLGNREEQGRTTQVQQWGIGAVLGALGLLISFIVLFKSLH